jgi:hypothetical protein
MERPIRVRVLLNLISFVIAKRVQLEKEKEIAAAKKKKSEGKSFKNQNLEALGILIMNSGDWILSILYWFLSL